MFLLPECMENLLSLYMNLSVWSSLSLLLPLLLVQLKNLTPNLHHTLEMSLFCIQLVF